MSAASPSPRNMGTIRCTGFPAPDPLPSGIGADLMLYNMGCGLAPNPLEIQMIGRIVYGACALALVTTTAVMAEPSGSSNNGANKQICRAIADTGSRLGHSRECHTAQE